jgi:two-component system NtrC family sensor kinase
VSDFLVKPFRPDELLDAVHRTLDAARARQEHARMQAELAATNTSLTQRLKELETLIGVGHEVTSVLDLDQVLAKVVEAAVNLTSAEEGALLLLDAQTNELTMRAAKNFDDQFVRTFRLRSEDSLAGQVIRSGQPVLLDDRSPQKIKTAYLVRSLLYVPIKVRGAVFGVLGVDNRRATRVFTSHDQRLLEALGDYAAIAIENAQLYWNSERERARWETILNETEDGVVVVDLEGRVIMINHTARAALGVKEGGLNGCPLDEVISQTEVRELFSGDSRRGEIKTGDGRTFNAHLTPISGVGRAMLMQDITHLKELDRIKSEFVTAVSHDLRSPLTAILGYVELIARSGPVSDQQAEFIRRVQYSVQSITSLITDLLDLGRIEAGFDTQNEVTHLSLVTRYAVDGLRQRAEAKHQTLLVDVSDNLPRVLGNPPRLRQMLANLLDNAIKYTPEGGIISMRAHDEGEVVILNVSDSGQGIPPGDQPYIFDKFYRAANARQETSGSGLGLAIVKSIVDNHGGRIWLESRPGEGTTFTVMLPQYKDEAREMPVVTGKLPPV